MSLYDDILVGFGTGFGNKVGKLYSLKPTDGTADFDTTRTGEATRVNQDKLIESQVADLPRADFGDFDCPTLLLEPASENLALWSEDFTDAVYIKGGSIVITPNTETSPDGTMNASHIYTGTDNLYQQILLVDGQDFTFSVYLKSTGEDGTFLINFYGGSHNVTEVYLTDKWQKFSITVTASGTDGFAYIGYTGDKDLDSIYAWGFQVEQVAYPTSYIPTEGASVSRGQDSLLGEVDSKNFSSEKGVLFFHANALSDNSQYIIIRDTAFINYLRLRTVSNTIQMIYAVNSVNQAITVNIPIPTIDFNKYAVTWKPNEFKLYANGFVIFEQFSGNTAPFGAFDQLEFNRGSLAEPWYGKTREIWHSGNTDFDVLEYTAYSDFDELVSNFKYNIQ